VLEIKIFEALFDSRLIGRSRDKEITMMVIRDRKQDHHPTKSER